MKKVETVKKKILSAVPAMLMLAAMCMPSAAAVSIDWSPYVQMAMDIICPVLTIVGIIFAIFGAFNLYSAISDGGQGPELKKAGTMLGGGVIMTIAGATSLFGIDFAAILG